MINLFSTAVGRFPSQRLPLKNKKLLPILGESWLTRFHPDYVKILKVLTYLLGANGADRFPYDVRVDLRSAPTIGGSRSRVVFGGGPEQARIRRLLSLSAGGPPTRPGHSVWAWWEYYMPLWRLVKRLEFTLIYPIKKWAKRLAKIVKMVDEN